MKPGWIAAGLFAVVIAFFLLTRVGEELAPEPVALWVAVQPDGAESARAASVEIEAGVGFRLRAVLEAETFRGARVYYTDAKQLEVLGRPVPAEAIRPWPEHRDARLLWFTVEGTKPYREIAAKEQMTAPEFREIFQPDWGNAWTVTASVKPAVENFLPGDDGLRREKRFGTQRFHVRIEIFDGGSSLVPELRLSSWGAEEVAVREDQFPAVTAFLPGALAVPSRNFGLMQTEITGGLEASEFAESILQWTEERRSFSRLTVLRHWLVSQSLAWQDLAWEEIELGVSRAAVRPGDLLRAGGRLVWYFEDRGIEGADDDDWCLDFERGARVQRIGDVFIGDGLVDWAKVPSVRGGS